MHAVLDLQTDWSTAENDQTFEQDWLSPAFAAFLFMMTGRAAGDHQQGQPACIREQEESCTPARQIAWTRR